MAFQLNIQRNKSEKNKLTKSVENLVQLSGTLKEETSIINPVIKVNTSLTNIALCNYMSIPTFGRSYFVTDIKSITNDLVEISAHVDVLSSYKEYILANTGIIKSQENDWNLYLNDSSFKVYQNPYVVTKKFPNGFSTQEFVLAVAG